MNESYIKLNNYVNRMTDLVEQLQRELRKGEMFSEDIVRKLDKALKAQHAAAQLIEVMQNIDTKLN